MVISPPRAAAYCFRSQRPVSVSHRACRMPALIYVFSISVVATILFVAVEDLEPNRCLALALKFLILFVTAMAMARRLMPNHSGPAKNALSAQ